MILLILQPREIRLGAFKTNVIMERYICTIPNYPRSVEVSKSRRPKYYKIGDKIPKKFEADGYCYVGGFLVDPTGQKVVKNTKSAGTPRYISINAQAIYVGLHHSVRSKIVDSLHSLFHETFKKQLPATIDLTGKTVFIHLQFYDVVSAKLPDLDNLANFFVKCGMDCLTKATNSKGDTSHKLGIIPDDKVTYVSGISLGFTEIKAEEQRELVFSIYVVDKTSPNVFSLLDQLYISHNNSI